MVVPTTIGRPSKDTLRLLYRTHMVTIEVGAEKEQFVVHQNFLCAKSPYFPKALSGSFQEAKTRCIQLPEISPILFRILVAWLYYGNLSYLPPLGRTIDQDFESLEITEENLGNDSDDDARKTSPDPVVVNTSGDDTASTPEMVEGSVSSDDDDSDYLVDDPTTWPRHILIQLYVLGDYFQIHEFKADSLDTLHHARKKQAWSFSFVHIRYIYNNTPAKSPLRKYVVHMTAYHRKFDEDVSTYATLPAEFLAAMLITSSRRLPVKQCSECYEDALQATRVKANQTDERDPKEDLPPYETDMCLYHEHSNKKDRETCRLRRKTLESDD